MKRKESKFLLRESTYPNRNQSQMDDAFQIVFQANIKLKDNPRAQFLLTQFLNVMKDLDGRLTSQELSEVIIHGKVFLLKPKRDYVELHRFLLENVFAIENSMIFAKKGLAGAIGEALAYTRFHYFNKAKNKTLTLAHLSS